MQNASSKLIYTFCVLHPLFAIYSATDSVKPWTQIFVYPPDLLYDFIYPCDWMQWQGHKQWVPSFLAFYAKQNWCNPIFSYFCAKPKVMWSVMSTWEREQDNDSPSKWWVSTFSVSSVISHAIQTQIKC